MADNYTELNAGSGGDFMDEESITFGVAPTTRKRPRVVIGGDSAAALAEVSNIDPSATDYGLITRNITTDLNGNIAHNATEESILLLRRIVKLLEPMAVVDNAFRQRITPEQPTAANLNATVSIAGSQTLTTVTGVTTCSTVTSMTQLAGVDARYMFTDLARAAYNTGMRNNLIFS